MDIWEASPMDTRPLFAEERRDLMALLGGLSADDWLARTPAGEWTVKDVSLHLLDGDLGRLSRGRDGDLTGLLRTDDPGVALADALAAKNQRWVEAARPLSPRVIRDLLRHSTEQLMEWTAGADLLAPVRVSWAGDGPVPAWLDLARELTETWVHHQQIRAGADRGTSTARLPAVLRTFVWALPHQYRVPADQGATVLVDLDTGGLWHLVATGGDRWSLEEGAVQEPTARVAFTAEAAWRSFTGAAFAPGAVTRAGPPELTEPVLRVRGIIA